MTNKFADLSLKERSEHFFQYAGPIDSPEKYTQYCIHLGRQSGKTTTLVDNLPKLAPAAVVCHNTRSANELEREFKIKFPNFTGKVVFCSYESMYRCLTGLEVDIYFDNAVQDMILDKAIRKVNNELGKRRSK